MEKENHKNKFLPDPDLSPEEKRQMSNIDITLICSTKKIYIEIGRCIIAGIDLDQYRNTEIGKPIWCFGFYRFYCSPDYETWWLDYHRTDEKDKVSFPEGAILLTFSGLYLTDTTLSVIIELKPEQFETIKKAWSNTYDFDSGITLYNLRFNLENIANDEHRITIYDLPGIEEKHENQTR